MFKKLEDFYTQEIRINLISAEHLARLNPGSERYKTAARDGKFVVSVNQGNTYEGVYTFLMERHFGTLVEAQQVFVTLVAGNPDATHFDFVSHAPAAF